MLIFEWDERKAASNLRKHGVTFEKRSPSFMILDLSPLIIRTTPKPNYALSMLGLQTK
jgi:uncharacterized DUF497 family protein